MPQFRVQRSNTLFVLKNFASFFFTQSLKDTRNKKKNANNRTRTKQERNKTQTRTKQDVNKSETRMQITEQGHKHEPGQITKEKIWIG